MGSIESCQNLNKLTDACLLNTCIAKVEGIERKLASPSNIWRLTFKSGTKYLGTTKEGVPLRGVLKWWIDPLSVYDPRFSRNIDTFLSLNYELEVYSNIIRPMLERKVCPNFLPLLFSSKGCPFNNLLHFLVNNDTITTGPTSKRESVEKWAELLQRNIMYSVNMLKNKPSINDPKYAVFDNRQFITIDKPWRYNMIVTKEVSAPTLHKFLKSAFAGKRKVEEVWTVLFQLTAACYAMSATGLVHNDLHDGNAWVYDTGIESNLYYNYGNKNYFVSNVTQKVIVYDFDRSYSIALGPNRRLKSSNLCEKYSQCNEFIPNRDIVKVLGHVYSYSPPPLKEELLGMLCPTANAKELLRSVYNEGPHMMKSDGSGRFTRKDYGILNNIDTILFNIAIKDPNISIIPKATIDYLKKTVSPENIYVCNRSMFKGGIMKEGRVCTNV